MLITSFILVQILCTFASANSDYLLPNTTIPVHYDLVLDVKLGPIFNYNGTVGIDVNVTKPTKTVVLHSQDLKIDVTKSFVVQGSRLVKVQSISTNESFSFLTLNLALEIGVGSAKVVVAFNGTYYGFARGLFISNYFNATNDKRYILATQFEPAHARNMFPCYDEPNLKTTFNVTVIHPSDYHALSNAAVSSRSVFGSRATTRFHTVPKMSTYLLAITVSDFQTYQGNVPNSETKIHIYSEPPRLGLTKFALNASAFSVYYLEELLQVKYSINKLDGVALQAFGGGMENWGLIIYGTSILKNASEAPEKLRGAINLIAHEIAHQWFGNLVTLDWWDYVWLNEGFATYYASVISDKLYPSLRFKDRQVVYLQNNMWSDAISSNPKSLNHAVKKPVDFMSKFDSISYDKGSAIVRFMRYAFEGYDQAITEYLKQRSYNNSKPQHLFDAINKFAKDFIPYGSTVHNIMDNWVNLGRFPLLTVNVTSSNVINVTQEEFVASGKPDSNKKWFIPLIFANETPTSYDVDPKKIKTWINSSQSSVMVKVDNVTGFVIANPQKMAFMHVNYDIGTWMKIIAFLKGPKYQNIHVLNRAQLIDDANKLAKVGKLNYSITLDLCSYLKQETDEIPLLASQINFITLSEYLKDTQIYPKYKKFVEDIFGSKKAKQILLDFDLESMVENCLKQRQPSNYETSFVELSERVLSKNVYEEVKQILTKSKSSSSLKQQFLSDLKHATEINIKLKDHFLKNSYADVESWLNRY